MLRYQCYQPRHSLNKNVKPLPQFKKSKNVNLKKINNKKDINKKDSAEQNNVDHNLNQIKTNPSDNDKNIIIQKKTKVQTSDIKKRELSKSQSQTNNKQSKKEDTPKIDKKEKSYSDFDLNKNYYFICPECKSYIIYIENVNYESKMKDFIIHIPVNAKLLMIIIKIFI